MPTSINGWSVLRPNSSQLKTLRVPGVPGRSITAHKAILPIFLALAHEYNDTIAPLKGGTFDEWSYSYRKSRMSGKWSDHSSGTAVDFNSAHEGAQGSGPYSWWTQGTRSEKAVALKRKYHLIWGGAESLGGDYSRAYWDWMHWSARPGTNPQHYIDLAHHLGINADGTTVAPAQLPVVDASKIASVANDWEVNSQVLLITKALNKVGIPVNNTSKFDAEVKKAYRAWQNKIHASTGLGIPDFNDLTKLGEKSGLFRVVA